MGSSQSVNSTTTIDNAIIEQHLQELQKLKSDLTETKDENSALKSDLLIMKSEFSVLKRDLDEATRNADTLPSEKKEAVLREKSPAVLNSSAMDEFSKLKQNLDEITRSRDMLLVAIARRRSELSEKNVIIDETKQELHDLTVEFKNTRDQLQKVSDDVRKLREDNSLQVENDNLQKQNVNLQSQISHLNGELKDVKNQLKQALESKERNKQTHDNKMNSFNKKYNLLNSKNSKLQSELQAYTSNKPIVQIIEFHQQLEKLDSQTDSTVNKLTTKIQVQKHVADEAQLKEQTYEYYQQLEKLKNQNITLSRTKFPDSMKIYKSVCEENDKKVKSVFKRIYEINKYGKSLCEQIKTNVCDIVDKFKPLMEAYQKETNELKQVTFVNDYKQEEKLYAEALEVAQKEKAYFTNLLRVCTETQPDTIKNNLNNKRKATEKKIPNADVDSKTSDFISNNTSDDQKSQEGWSVNVFEKNKSDDYKIIVYDFPESEHTDANKTLTDLTNIKYLFGKLGLGEIKNITVQRLPIPKNYKIRPMVVSLPNLEEMKRVLNCSKLLPQNIRIAKFNGKTNN